jgi:hypothetical protein
MAFVGFRNATEKQLRELVSHPAIALSPSYYFLRWFHEVSGIRMQLPDDFHSPEGQLFNAELELRWKQHGKRYEVLLLGRSIPNPDLGFSPLQGDWEWECCDRNAYFYDNDETKFPQGFLYQNAAGQMLKPKEIPVKQRYFRNSQTSTIHFVALTVGKKS